MESINVKNSFSISALGLSSLNISFIAQTLQNAYKLSGTIHASDVFRASFIIHFYAYHKLFLKIFLAHFIKDLH